MAEVGRVRILEKEANKVGDLFGRLMVDLFLALGYDRCRLNIHKSGREIDVEAQHRTEERGVIAECKATKEAIGGDDVNKFIGALDVERRKRSRSELTGYFISLAGFKETAVEQEKEAGGKRAVLLDGGMVVEELIKGRIIVGRDQAMEKAGRCAAGLAADVKLDSRCELLAHEIGWVWAAYFTKGKERTHFALIHADGDPLARSLAESVVEADRLVRGELESLEYLSPEVDEAVGGSQIEAAKKKYFDFVAEECGGITLEGLPADQEVGARRLRLESIFVPLCLESIDEGATGASSAGAPEEAEGTRTRREKVGQVLSTHSRLAILSAPGGGKSTLLKRFAVAYALPERGDLVDDGLPQRPWLPLFVRCRQLGALAKEPINSALAAIPQRAEMAELTEAFMALVRESLRSGNVLLLIDGLDEISDVGARVAFVSQLRTFLAVYPRVSIVVTSREAGFRIVAAAVSDCCKQYRIADFESEDIKRLVLAWHREVVGVGQEVRAEAEKLAVTICASDRVRQLATNPLLLTTLLLVKRWVGQLPTRRSVLYGKAIEVLLMTWNVEGYEPLDQQEVVPQLAFVAFAMMKEGVQTISLRRLRKLLGLARKEMPEVLAYSKVSVDELIERVELRSSLLVLSGHEIEKGTLYPTYEFRHLTFQEYLAAVAAVEGYYSGRRDGDTLAKVLEPYTWMMRRGKKSCHLRGFWRVGMCNRCCGV